MYSQCAVYLSHIVLGLHQNRGSITYVSPPIYSRFFKGKTAYAMGKIGMSVLCLGLAEDLKGTDIRVS